MTRQPFEEALPDPFAKRALDFVLALIGIVLSAPIWLVVAIAIKLDDRGPVFFRQSRVGKDGALFDALKFRTMVPDPDGTRVAQQGHPDDTLITRVGRFIRPTAIDELPQLLSILRGDMSLVGPRAVPPLEIAANGNGQPVEIRELPGYHERHRVRPGLTGPAQVRAPRDIPYRKKFRYDVFYVRHQSLGYDVQLIFQSIAISLTGRWPDGGRRLTESAVPKEPSFAAGNSHPATGSRLEEVRSA
jgi:lipopolysaccharide/colanic/teichoic acid biosynthesis glycosyltransferase